MKMLISRYRVTASAAILVAFCIWSLPVVLAQSGYRIAGKIVNSISGAPVSQAVVTIANVANLSETRSVITGDDGVFVFTGVAPGKYQLDGARRGFIHSAYDAHENFSTAIVTGGDADSEHLIFRLTPQAVLTGQVFDESGDPIRRANVGLYRQDQSTGVGLVRRVGAAPTDDRGTYEFAELPAGTYFLSVNAKPWYALHPHSIVNGGGTQTLRNGDGTVTGTQTEQTISAPTIAHSFDVAYPTTYYPDATDSDEAVPIPLRGGEKLSIDMHLTPVPALRILVRSPGGYMMPQLLKQSFDSSEDAITAYLMGGGVDPTENRAISINWLPTGEVEISGVPAGKYTVRMRGRPDTGVSGAVADFDISQDGQELDPSTASPASTAKLSVSVLGATHLPQGLLLALRTKEHRVIRRAPVDPSGAAQFVDVPPGKYDLLAATRENDYAVKRMVINDAPSNGHTLDVGTGSTIEGTVTLIGGQTIVQGVARHNGKGVPGAMIVMVPNDPEANGELFRRDQSDLDGTFSLGTVIPGDYTIVAIENGWDLNWSQPGVIAHYVEKGKKITVAAGARDPVHLSEPVEVQPR
jgi:protocatechuate 3,4-dioxygenase beta subunit